MQRNIMKMILSVLVALFVFFLSYLGLDNHPTTQFVFASCLPTAIGYLLTKRIILITYPPHHLAADYASDFDLFPPLLVLVQ